MRVFSCGWRCLRVLAILPVLSACASHDVHCDRHLQRINAASTENVPGEPQSQSQPRSAP